jgi:hypothetical protein
MREGDTAMLTKPIYGRQFFEADTGDGGGGGESSTDSKTDPKATTETPPKTEDTATVTFSAEQQKFIDKLMGDARKEGRQAAEKAANDAKAAADAERERQDQEAKGQYEEVKASLIQERDTAKTEADTLKARVEQYEALAAKRVDALKDELKLPDEVMKRFPDDADSLVKLTWLEEQGELAKLYRTEGGGPKDGVKLPKTPDANGTVPEMTKEQQAAYDRQFVRSF